MNAPPLFRAARCLPVMLALLGLGCSSPLDPTTRPLVVTSGVSGATEASQGFSATKGGFYPLALGNRWEYRRLEAVRLITFGEPPPPPMLFETSSVRQIVCSELWNEREYLVEETSEPFGSGTSWIRYRQDASGLYELDQMSSLPGCLPVGGEAAATGPSRGHAPTIWDRVVVRSAAERKAVAELRARVATIEALTRSGAGLALRLPLPQARTGELTRLRYPLRIKAGWIIRSDFPLRAEVAGLDALNLPFGRATGYRVELHSPAYGPNGLVWFWYGREGHLQTRAHLEVDLVDEGSNVIGVARFDLSERLTDVHLVTSSTGFPPPLGVPVR